MESRAGVGDRWSFTMFYMVQLKRKLWDIAGRLQERLARVSGVCRDRCQRFGPSKLPFQQISGFLAFERKCQCLKDAWFVSRPWCGTSRVATHGIFLSLQFC